MDRHIREVRLTNVVAAPDDTVAEHVLTLLGVAEPELHTHDRGAAAHACPTVSDLHRVERAHKPDLAS